MNKEFFEAVRELEKEKGIPAEYLYEKETITGGEFMKILNGQEE